MKTRLFTTCLVVILASIACTSKTKPEKIIHIPDFPIKIDLLKAIDNPKDIKLSEIADSIAYIPLEYIKEYPVGVIMDYKYFLNNLFIEVGGTRGGFLRFDGKGKFLNKIGTKGRGPGAYQSGSSFSVIDNPDRFFILCNFVPRRILEYDYTGNFLAEVLTAHPAVGKFEAISQDRFLFLSSGDTSFRYMASLNDRSNNLLMKVSNPFLSNPQYKISKQLLYGGTISGLYYDRWPLFYDQFSLDTIFSIKNDSIYSKYILDKGTEGAPYEKLYFRSFPPDPSALPERWNYLCPFSFNETPNDVFLSAIFKSNLYLINYNKSTQTVSSMNTAFVLPEKAGQPVTVSPKFTNDIDGGISLGPGKPNREGDVWTYKFDAVNFKNQLTKEHFLNSKALYPEKQNALMQLVDSIKEYDNPIIMVIYLKKSSK